MAANPLVGPLVHDDVPRLRDDVPRRGPMVTLAGGMLAAAILLVGCSDKGTPTASSSPTASPSSAPASPSVTPSKPVKLVKITNAAFLQQADTHSNEAATKSDEAMLPRLCAKAFASKSKFAERQARHILFFGDNAPEGSIPDGTFTQTITQYKPGGAAQFMTELRSIIAACPNDKINNRPTRYAIVPGTPIADDSFVFSMIAKWPSNPAEDDSPLVDVLRLISVVRIGDAVTVLWEHGWEEGSSDPAQVNVLTGRAVARMNTWLKG